MDAKTHIGSQPPGYRRAIAVHGYVNTIQRITMVENPEPKITCSQGCNHCCYLNVSTTEDEAALLNKIIKNGYEIDEDRVRIQAEWGNEKKTWIKQPKEKRLCVFNKSDGSCGIYENRPLMCRRMLCVDTVEKCKQTVESMEFTGKFVEHETVDKYIKTAFALSPTIDNIPRRLVKMLD